MTAPRQAAAFEAIYHGEYRRLLRKLRHRIGPDEAPDIVQDAFARLLRCDLDRVDNPQAYLSRIVRNALIDRVRRMQRVPIFCPFDEDRDAGVQADQAQRIEAIDLQRAYRRAVRAMPPKTRRVFVMHRVHHQSYKEIAIELGVCIQTVEYHMSKA